MCGAFVMDPRALELILKLEHVPELWVLGRLTC